MSAQGEVVAVAVVFGALTVVLGVVPSAAVRRSCATPARRSACCELARPRVQGLMRAQ